METFNQVLFYINNVLVTVIGVAFTVPLIYMLFFWLKAKHYPVANKKHRIGVVIPARNESEVIADSIKCILSSDYPSDKFDVYVVADNCTDNTAAIARAAGATVYERTDTDPNHHKAGYALKFLFEQLAKDHPDEYDMFIKFDADNLMAKDYLSRMNDAFAAGVKCARGYSNSKNLDQNFIAGISGIWYMRDCRFASRVRSALGTGTMLGGAGMMFDAAIIKKHGWDCLSGSDDTEFTMKRLNIDRIKTMYVEDAMVFEDQPSTIKDTFKRYKRMAPSLFKMFFTEGFKSIGHFFTRFGWTYLDMPLTLLFVPVAAMCCFWLPVYYGYDIIYHFCIGDNAYSINALITIGYILLFAFVLMFILQGTLTVALEHKKMNIKNKSVVVQSVLLFPVFMLIYAIAIALGVFSKTKWSAVKRNVVSTSNPVLETAAASGGSAGGLQADNLAENTALPNDSSSSSGETQSDSSSSSVDAIQSDSSPSSVETQNDSLSETAEQSSLGADEIAKD